VDCVFFIWNIMLCNILNISFQSVIYCQYQYSAFLLCDHAVSKIRVSVHNVSEQ